MFDHGWASLSGKIHTHHVEPDGKRIGVCRLRQIGFGKQTQFFLFGSVHGFRRMAACRSFPGFYLHENPDALRRVDHDEIDLAQASAPPVGDFKPITPLA